MLQIQILRKMQKLKETRRHYLPASKQQIILKFDNMKAQSQKQQQVTISPTSKIEAKNHLQISLEQIDSLAEWINCYACGEITSNTEMLKLCQEVIINYRKCLNQQQNSANKTLRFRIAKSAKKTSNRAMLKAEANFYELKLNGQTLQEQKENLMNKKNIDSLMDKQRKVMRSTLSTLPSNTSSTDQLRYFRKENKDEKLMSFNQSGCKTKSDYGINTDTSYVNVEKQAFTELQNKLKQALTNYQRQCTINDQINIQLQKMKQKNFEIDRESSLNSTSCLPFRIDLKCSFEVIEDVKNTPPKTRSKEMFSEADSVMRENIQHLQMMIISQNKQIEDLQTRVSSTSSKQSSFLAKASRWNAY